MSVVISSTRIFSSAAEDVTMLVTKVVSSIKEAVVTIVSPFVTSLVPNVTLSMLVIGSPSSTCTTLVEEVSSTDCVAIDVAVGDNDIVDTVTDTIVGDTLVDNVDDMSDGTVSETVVGNIE